MPLEAGGRRCPPLRSRIIAWSLNAFSWSGSKQRAPRSKPVPDLGIGNRYCVLVGSSRLVMGTSGQRAGLRLFDH